MIRKANRPFTTFEEFDGHLFIYEWMRNWIQTTKLGTGGPAVTPFLPDWNFRQPVDMKLGPDGVIHHQCGDKWWENTDDASRIRTAAIAHRRRCWRRMFRPARRR